MCYNICDETDCDLIALSLNSKTCELVDFAVEKFLK